MGANFNFNKVILGGRLTSDVELKQTQSGIPVCSFTVAVNRKASKNQETDFIKCNAWRATAEFISRYFRKGSSICVVGNIQQREWTDKDGNKRPITEVVVEEASFVDSKGDMQNEFAQSSEASSGAYMPPAYQTAAESKFEPVSTDDDLPF